MKSIALLCLFLSILSASSQTNRTALLMGVGDYSKAPGMNSLPGIDQDLKLMGNKLTDLGFTVYYSQNPNLRTAKQSVDEFGKILRKNKGIGLFYFSGHGAEQEGGNYLIPGTANIQSGADLAYEALSAQRVLNRMQESGSSTNLVFLDCCRNEFSKSGNSGDLAPMKAEGVFIGFATADDTSAGASTSGSIYTSCLVNRLGTPGVSISDMHTLVTRDVKKLAPKQNPFSYSGLDEIFYMNQKNQQKPEGRTEQLQPPSQTSLVNTTQKIESSSTNTSSNHNPSTHRRLKAQALAKASDKNSTIYAGKISDTAALISLQYLSDGIINGVIFLPEEGIEIRVYGENKIKGVMTLSLWESDNPLELVTLYKRKTPDNILTWEGTFSNGPTLSFARELDRKTNASTSNYKGKIGSSNVSVKLGWKNNGTVSGNYKSHTSGKTYRIAGDNLLEGFLYLDEFTNNKLSARMLLEKSKPNGKLTWSGTLYNVNGPRRSVTFSR